MRAHIGRQCRLIAHRRRYTAEQRRHFRTGLGKTENIVDKEENVLAFIAEMLGNGKARQAQPALGRRAVRSSGHKQAPLWSLPRNRYSPWD